ncbi:MAG: S4 domain-containing protein [Candidatus Zixiibacteriota bacterium]
MRLDQFLSISRLLKRRTQAKLACDKGLVYVDGIKAKPGKEVKVGQKIILDFTNRKIELEVLKLPPQSMKKEEVKELYRIISEEKKEKSLFE